MMEVVVVNGMKLQASQGRNGNGRNGEIATRAVPSLAAQ
jgi:hypothetical protein